MSAHYALEVFRARVDDSRFRSELSNDSKNLYVKVRYAGEQWKTHLEDGRAPVWNRIFTLSPLNDPQDFIFTVKLKKSSILPRRTCLGTATISLEELLSRSTQCEAHLDLLQPEDAGPSKPQPKPTAAVFLRLTQVDAMEKANIEIGQAALDVQQSGIADTTPSERLETLDHVVTRMNAQRGLAVSLANVLKRVDVFVGLVDKLSTIHPYARGAWQVASSLYKAVRNQQEADQRLVDLANAMEEIFNVISDVDFITNRISTLESPIIQFLQQSTECYLFIRQYIRRGFVSRMLDVGTRQKIDDFMARFRDLKGALSMGIELQTTFISVRMSEKVEMIYLRHELNPANMDACSRKQCLPGTRTEILGKIMDWLFSDTEENILWLHGVAGSGKSTISMTIAEYCVHMRRRGAHLFFERGKGDPNTVIRTIAFWLASFDKSIADQVSRALRDYSGAAETSSKTQFEKLLSEPLKAVDETLQGPIVIVLDALDECGAPDDREALLSLLAKEFPKLPRLFRFLVTSRPEADIHHALSSSPDVLPMELDYSSWTSCDDVRRYIDHELRMTFEKKNVTIPSDWYQYMDALSDTAKGLFVWASTTIKMITTSNFPAKELKTLVSYCRSHDRALQANGESGLTTLYYTVLDHSGIQWHQKEPREHFAQILGLILLSKVAISIREIDGILGFTEDESSRFIIERLPSVLIFTPGDLHTRVRFFHASFSDYLTTPECKELPWYIDVSAMRIFLASRCFDVMADKLRFNICSIESSFVRNENVPGIEDRVRKNIPTHVQYACLYWEEHLRDVPSSPDASGLLRKLDAFSETSLLYWLEVLSLTGNFGHASYYREGNFASRTLADASKWAGTLSAELASFLRAGCRLASDFDKPMSESVPHIYLSALSLAKGGNTTADHYSLIHPLIQVDKLCNAVSVELGDVVWSITFSPDGRRAASGTARTGNHVIWVWNTEGRELVTGLLTGHNGAISSVAFSPDGKHIASGSRDKTTRVWNIENGKLIAGPFTGHCSDVLSVAFSPDGKHIASGSEDKTIRVWNAKDGKLVAGPFTGHDDAVLSVAFSPDAGRIASGSFDKTIRLWNTKCGKLIAGPLKGHNGAVLSVAFSPDGRRVASGSYDKAILVWNAENGEIVAGPLMGHDGAVLSVAFSPDAERVASGSIGKTIRVWNIESGKLVAGPLTGHCSDVVLVAFSPDGKHIASGSGDRTIRMWNAEYEKSNSTSLTAISTDLELGAQYCDRIGTPTGGSRTKEQTSILNDLGIGPNWNITRDGWLIGNQGELLLWVPSDVRRTLWQPLHTAACKGVLSRGLYLTECNVGPGWYKAYKGKK